MVRQVVLGLCAAAALTSSPARAQVTPTAAGGRIAGRVIDGATGRPLAGARVSVAGVPDVVETDLDGRFRTGLLSAGLRSISAGLIGFKPVRLDSIRVESNQTAVVTIALTAAPVQLEEIKVTSDRPAPVSSAQGLLAAQQSAMAVVDGVSAETISKTPDSDAGQAVTRITGLAVVQDKVVVRGLSERYSTSLLNGVEIASPEPEKKFVPLDIFASGLIESIIAAKTATPDRPGDFAGGILDIQTKEFPENFVLSFGMSEGYNSRSTFKSFPRAPRSGSDLFGFDGRARAIRGDITSAERFAEGLSGIWTPGNRAARPAASGDFSIGGRTDLGKDALGFVFALNYGTGRENNPDRYDASGEAPFRIQESNERVEVGGILNATYRLGASQKFGLKNFYSRGSNELVRQSQGGDSGDGPSLNYQVDFVEQYVEQTQLTGDHYLKRLLNSRLEWKGSYGQASRRDLDNRQLRYFDNGGGFIVGGPKPSYRYNADLLDKTYSGQADWSIPLSFRSSGDALFKVGGIYRKKDRDFDARGLEMIVGPDFPTDLRGLPPEQLLAPENLGPGLISYAGAGTLSPYTGRDQVKAGYGMLDFELLPSVRIVGGARWEQWAARLQEGADARIRTYDKGDLLWSANLSYALSNTTNFRLAGYRTVVRPDLRELSPGGYTADVGGFPVVGDTTLTRSSILNGDARFEVYPAAEELFAVSLFYKRFDQPLLIVRRDAGGNVISPVNGDRATSVGAELEFRKRLGFLARRLQGFLVTGNVTALRSRIKMPASLGTYDPKLHFQGQSPYLVNVGVIYASPASSLSVSVLFNRFGERILQYGSAGNSGPAGERQQGYNVVERARSSLDAKIKVGIWRGWSLSISGKNLLDSPSELAADQPIAGKLFILGRSINGISISTGLSYAR
jgi:hypothetical protein